MELTEIKFILKEKLIFSMVTQKRNSDVEVVISIFFCLFVNWKVRQWNAVLNNINPYFEPCELEILNGFMFEGQKFSAAKP